ncbi:MAG: helix-turn-helix transcriptional regulator [Oscillospiraceae bacterium]|nr:helix-turn-helix transcriptional regulator [Oscillospiraceae bacterium]
MASKKTDTTSSKPDRLGKFIGQLRVHEGITLHQLARGLCSPAFLNRIENGEREVKKQLADILFQRLGKPAKLFERMLDLKEFQNWKLRQEIIAQLYRGDIDLARTGIKTYLQDNTEVWDQQLAA